MRMKLLLITVLGLLHSAAGDPRLVCKETVEAQNGDDVVLPCHLQPEENIEDETINCKRIDLIKPVYARRNRRQLPDQDSAYKNRTSLNTEDLKNGILNLKISLVTKSDNGKFQFYIPKWRINSTVNLVVGDPPSRVPPSRDPPSGVPPSRDPPSGVPPSRDPPSGVPPSRDPPSGVPPSGDPRLVCPETVETRIGDDVVLPCHLQPEENIEAETIDCKRTDLIKPVYARRNRRELPDQDDAYKHRTSLNTEELKNGVLNLKINSVTQSDNGTYQFYIRKWRINSTVNLVVGENTFILSDHE